MFQERKFKTRKLVNIISKICFRKTSFLIFFYLNKSINLKIVFNPLCCFLSPNNSDISSLQTKQKGKVLRSCHSQTALLNYKKNPKP